MKDSVEYVIGWYSVWPLSDGGVRMYGILPSAFKSGGGGGEWED